MIRFLRTNSKNKDFVHLVESLNHYLKIVDGHAHDFHNQYNGLDDLKHVIISYVNNITAGFGAFKAYDKNSVEIKRMYTNLYFRGQGKAPKILLEIEKWTKEEAFKFCILETGKRQTEAVLFYKKMEYAMIPNYGPYQNISNSICLKKGLS